MGCTGKSIAMVQHCLRGAIRIYPVYAHMRLFIIITFQRVRVQDIEFAIFCPRIAIAIDYYRLP